MSSTRKGVVVGAGPVGCLAALSLAKNGWDVTVYDARPGMSIPVASNQTNLLLDMRLAENKSALTQRSINLAISSRGITALHSINPESATKFLESAIPMRGRMIHPMNDRPESQLYDLNGQVRSNAKPT